MVSATQASSANLAAPLSFHLLCFSFQWLRTWSGLLRFWVPRFPLSPALTHNRQTYRAVLTSPERFANSHPFGVLNMLN